MVVVGVEAVGCWGRRLGVQQGVWLMAAFSDRFGLWRWVGCYMSRRVDVLLDFVYVLWEDGLRLQEINR